jgi:hypothetical protein
MRLGTFCRNNSRLEKGQIPGLAGINLHSGDLAKSIPGIQDTMKSSGLLNSLMSSFLDSQTAINIETMNPQIRTDARRIKMVHGPYDIKGLQVSNLHHT